MVSYLLNSDPIPAFCSIFLYEIGIAQFCLVLDFFYYQIFNNDSTHGWVSLEDNDSSALVTSS